MTRCAPRSAAPLAVLAMAALGPGSASAQDGASLYRAGVEAYGRGDYDVACRQFAESHRVQAKSAPLYMLGRCQARRGKLATAMRHFEEVLSTPAADAATRDHAQRELDALRSRVPKVVVAVAPDAPAGIVATLDGAPIAVGTPVPVDPGQHQLEIAAPGMAPERNLIEAVEALTVTVTAAPRPLPTTAAPATSPPALAPVADSAPPRESGDTMRTAAFVVGGAGIAALGAAVVTGILVLDRSSTFDDPATTPAERDDARSSGETLITVNWVAWGVGLAGVGVGAALLIGSSGGSASAGPSARVSLAPGGAAVRGRF